MASPATEGLRFLRFYSRIHTSKVCHQLSETSYTERYRIRRCCREERGGKRFSISSGEGPAHCVRSNTFALHLASTFRLSMRIPTNSNVIPHVEWRTGNLDMNTTGLFYRSRLSTRRDRRTRWNFFTVGGHELRRRIASIRMGKLISFAYVFLETFI